ncbi:MAG: VOC family protein, partial [Pseudomonadota bacterium]|nr:VOC family protein [Pseudomonadota bacterium]
AVRERCERRVHGDRTRCDGDVDAAVIVRRVRDVERDVVETAPIEAPVDVNPLDLRRTTLVVRDIEKSLALYRDALGMTVEYDQELTSPGLAMRYGADGQNRSRLVLLKANDSFIGMLGLWQFLDQTEQDLAEPDAADFTPGEIVLLFNSKTLDVTFPAAAAAPGVTIIGEPKERRYPSPAGDIVVLVSMLVDNDGHTIELNQIVSDPRQK